MASFKAGTLAYLGTQQAQLLLNGEEVFFNTFTTGSDYAWRNDPYSASLFLAMPGSLFHTLGMTSGLQDVSSYIRGTGNNISLVPTGSAGSNLVTSSAYILNYSGSNWADQGYTTAISVVGAQNAGALTWQMCTGSNGSGMNQQDFVIEGFIAPRSTWGLPPFQLHIMGDRSGDSLLTQWSLGTTLNYYLNGSSTAFGFTATQNTYYHFAFVRSGTNKYIYINGTRVATGTFSVDFTSQGFNAILGAVNSADAVNKSVQDFRVYIGTDKGYNTSTITVPSSMVEKI